MTKFTTETLDEKIVRLTKLLSRTGDEYLARVLRIEIETLLKRKHEEVPNG